MSYSCFLLMLTISLWTINLLFFDQQRLGWGGETPEATYTKAKQLKIQPLLFCILSTFTSFSKYEEDQCVNYKTRRSVQIRRFPSSSTVLIIFNFRTIGIPSWVFNRKMHLQMVLQNRLAPRFCPLLVVYTWESFLICLCLSCFHLQCIHFFKLLFVSI